MDRVGGARCPVLVIHGTHDEVVPFWHGQELFLATRPEWRFKPFWITGAGHNNIELLLRDSGALFKGQLGASSSHSLRAAAPAVLCVLTGDAVCLCRRINTLVSPDGVARAGRT